MTRKQTTYIRIAASGYLAVFLILPIFLIAQPAYAQDAMEDSKKVFETNLLPDLNIDIPTVQFSDIKIMDDLDDSGNVMTRTIDVPWLAEYVVGVYKFGVGIAGALAAVMMMIGGFQYLTAGGDASRVGAAKKRISDALVGLMLTLGVYLILFTLSPDLVKLDALTFDIIETRHYIAPPENEDEQVSGSVAANLVRVTAPNIRGGGSGKIPSELAPKILAAATELAKNGYGISIASSYRAVEKQESLILQNCKNPPGSATCDPKCRSGKDTCKPGEKLPLTCMLKKGPSSCPHTTGRALDIWGLKKNSADVWEACVTQKECLGNMAACHADPCQKAVQDALKAEGFCVLSGEAWHFEQPKMSKGCSK